PARHELDEERSKRDSGQRAEPPDDGPDHEQQRLVEGKRGRADEPIRDEHEQRTADARVEATDPEREHLVEAGVDPRRSRRDLAVANGAEGAPDPATDE